MCRLSSLSVQSYIHFSSPAFVSFRCFRFLASFPDDSNEPNVVSDLKSTCCDGGRVEVDIVSLPSHVFESKWGCGGSGGGVSELTTILPLDGNACGPERTYERGKKRKENYINLSPHALALACTSARLIKANDRRKSAVSSRPHENTTPPPPLLQHNSNPASLTKAAARGLASLQLETLVTTKGTLFHAHPFPPPFLLLPPLRWN